MSRLPLTRLVYRAAVAPTVRQQGALYLGVLIAAAIVFQPVHGLRAVQVTDLMALSRPARLGLWAGWLLLTLPFCRGLLRAPSLLPLRALPVRRARFLAPLGAALLLAEGPFALLFLRGVGVLAGLAALLSAAAAHALLLGRRPRPGALLGALLLAPVIDGRLLPGAGGRLPPLGPLALGLDGRLALGVLLALAALPLCLRAAYRAAAEPAAAPLRLPFRGPAPLVLLVYHLAVLLRSERAAVLRALCLSLLGAVVAWLCARNNGFTAPADRRYVGLVTLAFAAAIGAGGLSGRALRAEQAARWLLDSIGTGGVARVVGSAGAVALLGGALGAAHGALLSALLPEPAAHLLPQAALLGAALSALLLSLARRQQRGDDRDGDRLVVLVILAIAGAEILLYGLRDLGPPALALMALCLCAASVGWAAPRGRRARRRFGVKEWTSE